MKSKYLVLLGLAFVSALDSRISNLFAQGTAFTYQGRLNDSSGPANGSYDLVFTLFDVDTDGAAIAAPVTNSATVVSNGLFTTTIDFGPGMFTGGNAWLEIAVQTNGGSGFTTLTPRQQITPAPYAIYSGNAALADQASSVLTGVIAAPQLNTLGAPGTGQVLGYNGSQLVWQDPVIGGSSGGWSLTGNLGTTPGINFLGTADSQPLEIRVGGVRALRFEPDVTGAGAPNLIGGSPANYVSDGVVGATIAGGGAVNYSGATYSNSVTAIFATIGGGVSHVASGAEAFVGGGYQNTAGGYISTVAGGAYNQAYGSEATVVGGAYNVATNTQAFVGGGYQNTASGIQSVVGGGNQNGASGYISTIAGGAYNLAYGSEAAVGGGAFNVATNDQAFVGAGYQNTASGLQSFVGAGYQNNASGIQSFVGSGFQNGASGYISTVAGGAYNTASGSEATVPGGAYNVATGDFSFAAGYEAQALHNGSFVWADSVGSPLATTGINQFLIRAGGGVGIGTAQTPPGGLNVASGGLAVSGASSPNYGSASGVFIEKGNGIGAVYAYNYGNFSGPLSLCLNTPGGNVGIGTLSPQNTLDVAGTTRTHSVIITGGADLAEPFKIAAGEIQKGSVVVIDEEHPGELKLSTRAYDTHVAGIVSGANGINPGISLHQEGTLEGGQNVALTGRVYVQADAGFGEIKAGDLLTTSDTPGHAMKVTDHAKAQGAILGKAMGPLKEGRGLVLVLVTLQ